MNIYTLKSDPKVMGEKDEKYGFTFWGYVEEIDLPIMFNSMNGNILKGDRLSVEKETPRQSSKGTDYLRLSGVKISGSGESQEKPVEVSSPSPTIKESHSSAADSKYLKDLSSTPIDIFKACLPYSDFNTLSKGSTYYSQYMEFVKLASDELLDMMENVRKGEAREKAGIPPTKKFEFKKLKEEEEVVEPDEREDFKAELDEMFPDEE